MFCTKYCCNDRFLQSTYNTVIIIPYVSIIGTITLNSYFKEYKNNYFKFDILKRNHCCLTMLLHNN